MTIRQALGSRWRYDAPRLQPVKVALERIFEVYDDVRERHAAIAKNGKLSALGRQDAFRQHLADKTATELHRAGRTVESMQASLDAWRARLQPKSEKTTQLRGEMRTFLRSMKVGERIALLMSKDVDPEYHLAAIEAPNEMSGLTPDLRSYVVGQVVERTHPGQIAQIAEAEEALGLLNAAAQVTRNTVRTAAEFPNDTVLTAFVDKAIEPKRAAIDAEVERSLI